MKTARVVHGGPDELGVPLYDFSTNGNAHGPCPWALAAVQAANVTCYPDPCYTSLRAVLAAFHGVDPARLVLAGSASEFIYRVTAWAARHGTTAVHVPNPAYSDYANAARAWGLQVTHVGASSLQWHADPSSPLGQSPPLPPGADISNPSPPNVPTWVLDRAYEPLRLSGHCSWTPQRLSQVWQLWTPNKAMGLTGVRAAYAISPIGAAQAVAELDALCPSWPIGADGAALLNAWAHPKAQTWLAQSLNFLCSWKARQINLVEGMGWTCLPSATNFFCARVAEPAEASNLAAKLVGLRQYGIKLRDAASFGYPGHVRLGVLPPTAQDALVAAWQDLQVPAARQRGLNLSQAGEVT